MKITTKNRLREHVISLAQGALGGYQMDPDDELGLLSDMGLDDLARFWAGLQIQYGEEVHDWAFKIENLWHLDSVEGTVEYLWSNRKPGG